MPNTTYDQDADEQHDLSRLKSAEKQADASPHAKSVENRADTKSGGSSSANTSAASINTPWTTSGLQKGETEASGGDTVGKGYRKTKNAPGKGIRFRGGFWNKKRAGIAGGILGVGIGGGLIIGTISVGPLELLTASQAIQKSFAKNEGDSSSRMSQLFKYARFAKTGDIGETRVSYVGSKIFGSAVEQLKGIGIEFSRDPITGRPKQMTIDQQKLSENIPELKDTGLGSNEAKSIIANNLKGIATADLNGGANGKFTVDLTNDNIKSISSLRALTKSSLGLLNGKILSTIKMGPIGKFFNLPSWLHPFSKARAAAEQAASDAIFKEKVAKGESPAKAQAEAAAEASTQVETQTFQDQVTKPTATDAKANSEAIKAKKSGVTANVSKALTFTGAACIVRNTAGNIAQVNRDLVIIPAMAAAARIASGGEQVKSNDGGVTIGQVGSMVNSFKDADGKTILDGQAMRYLMDSSVKPTGTDLTVSYKQAFRSESTASDIKAGADKILDLATAGLSHVPGINVVINPDSICSDAGLWTQAIVAIGISIGSEVVSGGSDTPVLAGVFAGIKAIGNMAISMVAFGAAVHFIENVATDNQLPAKIFAGPIGGDLIAFGSRALSGAAAIASGGISLENNISTMPDTSGETQISYNEFKQQSLASRMFSLKDGNSLTAHLAMSYYGSGFSQGITGAANALTHIGSFLTGSMASILPTTSADSQATYNWGFPQYGIPKDMLDDPTLDDPYANAETVAKLLDSDATRDSVVQKANTCFGVNIAKDSNGLWNVTPDHAVDTGSDSYTNGGCTEDSNSGIDNADWRKVILFVFDTTTINSVACYNGDAQSCAYEDNTAAGSDANNPGSQQAQATGDTVSLAKQILSNTNITLSASSRADLQAASEGQKVMPGPIGDGSSGLPGCSARTPAYLNAELLKTALNIAQKYQYQINDISSGHDCDTGQHPRGRAMDIFFIAGQPLDDNWWSSDTNVATVNDIGNIVHNTGSYQFGFGVGCTAVTKIQPRGNLVVFNDSCQPHQDEIHIDVRGAP